MFVWATLRLSVWRKMKNSSFSFGCLLRFSAFFWSPGSKQVHPTLQATTKYSMLLPGNFLFLRETINTFESGKKIKSPLRKSIPNLKHGFHRENRDNTSLKSLLRKKQPLTKISEDSGDEFPWDSGFIISCYLLLTTGSGSGLASMTSLSGLVPTKFFPTVLNS